jgi:hypothetical protein
MIQITYVNKLLKDGEMKTVNVQNSEKLTDAMRTKMKTLGLKADDKTSTATSKMGMKRTST